jgi:hypothetical protein
MNGTAGSKRSRTIYSTIAIVCGVGCLLVLPYGLVLTLAGGPGLGLVVGGLVLGGATIVALYARSHASARAGGPFAEDSVSLMPPVIQRHPVGWTGYGVSGAASELPRSPGEPN